MAVAACALVPAGCSLVPGGTSDTAVTGHRVHGMHGMHGRSSSCSAPTSGTTVRVTLMDMGGSMMGPRSPMVLRTYPAAVPAGRVTLVAANLGHRTHELVVLPLAHGAVPGHRTLDARGRAVETGSLGEASRSCGAGTGSGIRPGTEGWTTLRLGPGRYELICNVHHHYTRGMYAVLVVR